MAGMGKVNTGAMEAQMNTRLKMAKTKERIRAKAEANAKAKAEAQLAAQMASQIIEQQPILSDEELLKFINSGDKIERTPRGSKPQNNNINNNSINNNNKKKKGKK